MDGWKLLAMDSRDLTQFRKTEQFVQFYYQTFDNNRPQLAGLYVRLLLLVFIALWDFYCPVGYWMDG